VEVAKGDGGSSDARLILQIGMLFALLYVAFLCAWFFATRRLRADGAGMGFAFVGKRVHAWWAERVVKSGQATRAPPPAAKRDNSFTAAGANPEWTCEIAYQPGQIRFQAVMAPHDAAAPHVTAPTKRTRWPKGFRRPSTHELEGAVGALFASMAAAGWEPAPSRGPWSERRFVWRQEGEPPTSFELVGDRAAATAVAERPAPPERTVPPARPRSERAPRGANRDAVLRTVAARPGATLRDLTAATGVKRSSLPPLLRTLTQRGEIEKRTLPDGQTGYALPRPDKKQAEADDARKAPR